MRMLTLLLTLMLSGRLAAGPMRDVAYGAAAEQHMDIYLPAAADNAPVLLMVHGGSWRYGDKNGSGVAKNKVARWVSRGWIFVSVNYRLLPDAGPLAQAEDVARALAFAQEQASSWGGDPSKFVLMGHSAGAHLISVLAARPGIAFKQGARPWLGTISLDSAAFDVVQIMQFNHPGLFDRAFGKDPAYWESASPLQLLSPDAMPMLAVCSTKRRDQPCIQARKFAARAASLQLRVEVVEQALSHAKINSALGLPGPYTEAVEKFMASLHPSINFSR